MSGQGDARHRVLRTLRERERADALCALKSALDAAKRIDIDREVNEKCMTELCTRVSTSQPRSGTIGGRMARTLENQRALRAALERHRGIDTRLARDQEDAARAVDAARERVALAQKALNVLDGKSR